MSLVGCLKETESKASHGADSNASMREKPCRSSAERRMVEPNEGGAGQWAARTYPYGLEPLRITCYEFAGAC